MHSSEGILFNDLNGSLVSTSLWLQDNFVSGKNDTHMLHSDIENSTYDDELLPFEKSSDMKRVIDIMLLVSLVLIMLCMGCEITKEQFISHIKKPIGISIGIFSQFVVLPLCAFTLLQCTSLDGLQAAGVLIISCSPGGTISNVFAYFCDGDLSLSVAMTSLSTLMAMGMMPLNLWMYGRSFETEGLVIPYSKLAVSLACVTSPVIVGMVLRWRSPRVASFITKVCGSLTGIVLIICLILQFVEFPNMFTFVPAELFAVTICLPIIGFTLGYGLALLFRQNTPVRKTIAIECGVQNVPTAIAVISLSFPLKFQKTIIPIPHLYFFTMSAGSTVFCCLYQVYKRCILPRIESKENISTKEKITETGKLKCHDNEALETMLKPGLKEPCAVIILPE